MDELELRSFDLFEGMEDLEVRAEAGKPTQVVGYAAVYNVLSSDLGGFRERLLPGAFKATLSSGQDVRALVEHDPNKLLGRLSSGTLRLSEDTRGLKVAIDLPDTSYARDLVENIRRRDIRGMSYGFKVPAGGDRFNVENGIAVRTISAASLFEVTVTSIPAFTATSVALRVDPALAARAKALESRENLRNRQSRLRSILCDG